MCNHGCGDSRAGTLHGVFFEVNDRVAVPQLCSIHKNVRKVELADAFEAPFHQHAASAADDQAAGYMEQLLARSATQLVPLIEGFLQQRDVARVFPIGLPVHAGEPMR